MLTPFTPVRLLTAWQLDGVVVAAVSTIIAVYLHMARRVRMLHPRRPWPRRRTASFLGGSAIVVLATCSAVGVYDMTQFWMHMVQHLLLIMVAPALLAGGHPITLALHANRNPWHTRIKRVLRSRTVTVVTAPPVAVAAYAVTIVATHLTRVMDRVMQRPWLGQLEHLTYLVAGYLLFVLVIGEEPLRWRLSPPARLFLLAIAMAVDTFVGIVLLSTNQPIVMVAHPGWGLQALPDTHAGGGVMWVFGDALMIVVALVVFASWARDEHSRMARSWFERARASALDVATGQPPTSRTRDVDADDARLIAYNDWLARLGREHP